MKIEACLKWLQLSGALYPFVFSSHFWYVELNFKLLFSCFSDAYPLQQVDYFWKATDKQGIVILADEMNEYTLTDIKTKKGLVHYGTRSSSKSEFKLGAIVLLRITFRIASQKFNVDEWMRWRIVQKTTNQSIGESVSQWFGRSVGRR